MRTVRIGLLAAAAIVGLSAAAPAWADSDDWRWRRHEAREHAWREHHWHRPGYVYAPPVVVHHAPAHAYYGSPTVVVR